MNCGSQDFLCYLLGLLAQHGVELSSFGKIIPWIGDLVTQHAQAILGLMGLAFGIWKWWRFHDRVLHKRLREYLALQDRRLTDARSYIVEALHRPGAERSFAEPSFAVRPLRKALRRRNWTPWLGLAKLETGAERQLTKALRQIDHRLEAAERQLRTLRLQQASAHFLKGAISSARAGQATSEELIHRLDYRSLDEFRATLQVPGHEADLEALKFEAHQLLRLGYLKDADTNLQDLEAKTASIAEQRKRDLFHAQLKRDRATIAQARAIERYQSGSVGGSGSTTAHALLCQNEGQATALQLRSRHAPYQDWDALEQGDLHYRAAFICNNLGYTNQRDTQLQLADTEYRRILMSLAKRNWLISPAHRRLKAAAEKGIERVAQAQNTPGTYDERWLLPPSQPTQRPAADESESGGNQTVQQAAKQRDIDDPSKT